MRERIDRKLTKQPRQMLRTINIQRTLISQITTPRLPLLAEKMILLTFESVKEDLIEGLIEVFPDALDDFFENVRFGWGGAFWSLFLVVFFEDLVHGVLGG